MIILKKTIIICSLLIVVTCLIAVVYWYFTTNNNEETNQINLNDAKYVLNDQYNNVQTLEQYSGKKVILVFWQIWCPPCREELKTLDEIYEELGNNQKDVILLTATKAKIEENDYEGDKTIDEIKEYLVENNHKFPVMFDAERALLSGFSVTSYPTTIILDENGNEVNRKSGQKLTKEEIYELIN